MTVAKTKSQDAEPEEQTLVEFVLRSVAPRGKGKAWVAECLGPWVPGDTTARKYVTGYFDRFLLKTGCVYFAHDPTPVELDEEPAEDAEPQFTVRRYYVEVREDEVVEISEARANMLMAKRALARQSAAEADVRVTAVLKDDALRVTGKSGASVVLKLSPQSLYKLTGGRDGR